MLHAYFVHQGLRWGFDLGFSPSKLPGRRFFKNYKSATDAATEVSKNIHGRLKAKKSYPLCPFDPLTFRSVLSSFLPSWCVFPLGAVPKSSEPGAFRPISDHSRTGFNDASFDDHLRHSLRTVPEIGRLLQKAFHMAVHDIDAAFPLLPLSPVLWPFFLFVWTVPRSEDSSLDEPNLEEWLCWHVCGDFGAKGLPGTFKIFFTDVIVGMARSEGSLQSPSVVHVDDVSIIDGLKSVVDDQADALALFLDLLGTPVKVSKHREASQCQFVVGFWWDSIARTRTLEEQKVLDYIKMFREFSRRKSLSLKEIQSVAGRLQRAVLTLPPGASCLLSNLFALMRGLSRPHDRRRTSSTSRRDLSSAAALLGLNRGEGYFSYDQFTRAPPVFTDASKSSRYVGGGYLSFCGAFSWWKYGASASRKPIDTLEGDVVVRAARDLGHTWKKRLVPFHIDNQAFQASAVKGWSHAERLSELIRTLFFLAISFECVFEFNWISTHDNIFADALSRPDPLSSFLALTQSRSDLLPPNLTLRRAIDAGGTKNLEPPPSILAGSATELPGATTFVDFGKAFSSDVTGDGPSRGRLPVAFSVSYPRASIFTGLPSEDVRESIDSILSDRLSASSHSSIQAALGHWSVVTSRHVWPRVIFADDPMRGGKLATFVSYLVRETEIKATSISNYVWALRQWFKLQHQPDPILGVLEWDDFMQSVDVVAWVASEPRKPVPLAVVQAALESVDLTSFAEVQTALLIVILFFTFARSESPCPKSFTGSGSFDPTKHLQVHDVEVRSYEGRPYVAIRLKSIKQDPRVERPEASGNEDWIYIGNVDGPFSILLWLSRFWAFFPADGSSPPRPPDSPFFRDQDGERVLTYSNALRVSRLLYARVAPPEAVATYGLHGLRVEAYNRARAHDPLLAVAQGGWASAAHKRYARFSTLDVLALPGAMIAGGAGQSSAGGAAPDPSPLYEPPAEIVLPRSSGPRLGRARSRSAPTTALTPSPPSPSRRAVSPLFVAATAPRARTVSRPSKPRKGPSAPSAPPEPRVGPSAPSAPPMSPSTPLPPPPPPVVRRNPRGGARSAAFAGSYPV